MTSGCNDRSDIESKYGILYPVLHEGHVSDGTLLEIVVPIPTTCPCPTAFAVSSVRHHKKIYKSAMLMLYLRVRR